MAILLKDPDAVLDYGIDWGAEWLAVDEEITSSTWVVPVGITKDSDTSDTTTATVWLSGGTVNSTYEVTNRITTNQGRADDRTITILVRQR